MSLHAISPYLNPPQLILSSGRNHISILWTPVFPPPQGKVIARGSSIQANSLNGALNMEDRKQMLTLDSEKAEEMPRVNFSRQNRISPFLRKTSTCCLGLSDFCSTAAIWPLWRCPTSPWTTFLSCIPLLTRLLPLGLIHFFKSNPFRRGVEGHREGLQTRLLHRQLSNPSTHQSFTSCKQPEYCLMPQSIINYKPLVPMHNTCTMRLAERPQHITQFSNSICITPKNNLISST